MPAAAAARVTAETSGSRWAVLFPLAVVVLSGLWLVSKAYTPRPSVAEMDLSTFGRLPVMYEGRVKPLDTLARNSLRVISDRQEYRDANGQRQPAIRWLLT